MVKDIKQWYNNKKIVSYEMGNQYIVFVVSVDVVLPSGNKNGRRTAIRRETGTTTTAISTERDSDS